jgi:phosphatidylglycerol:prolipoprotein diacylglycerol transferase
MPHLAVADLINWGWLRIGPPYIYIDVNPVIFQMGPLAVRWYGLMYVVGILVGLQVTARYTTRKGISEEALYRTLWWSIVAGLLGGRLYFVIQQHDLVQNYLQKPWRILATWEGGMAFYGAIFFVIPTLYLRARAERINPLVLIDAGVLFATVGQIFGRIGNLINGDIIGYRSTLPWSTVYVNPNSWACNPYVALPTCGTPVQPAAGYELISNLVLLAVMLYLAHRVTRPGILMLVYLYSYSILQFFLFFVRDNSIETPFGLDWGLKQAQWTSLVLLIVLLPITYWVLRTSKPIPAGEIAATYGIPQRFKKMYQQEVFVGNQTMADRDEDALHLKQDSGLGSEDTELILKSDPDTTTDLDNAQVTLPSEPDMVAISDASHVEPDDTHAQPDTLLVSDDDTQTEPTSDLVSDTSHVELDDTHAQPDTLLVSDDDTQTEPTSDLVSDDIQVEPNDTHAQPDILLVSDDDTQAEPTSDLVSDASHVELDDTHAQPDTLLISDDNTQTEPTSDLVSDDIQVEHDDTHAQPDTLLVSDDDTQTEPTSDLVSDTSHVDPDPSPIPDASHVEPNDTHAQPDTLLVSSDDTQTEPTSDLVSGDSQIEPDPSPVPNHTHVKPDTHAQADTLLTSDQEPHD